MQDHHVSSVLSALVMLGAIGLTYTTYSSYKVETAMDQQEQATIAMDQTANAFLSYKAEKAALTTVSTTTEETSTSTKKESSKSKSE
jgi:maltodextrin utilization protein YvdJ